MKLVAPEVILGDTTPGKKSVNIRNTYNTEEELYEVVMKLQKDWEAMAEKIVEWDARGCEDADFVIVSHGVVSRAALAAYDQLRAAGKKVGVFRPITIRPFPEMQLREAIKGAKKVLVAESSYGQLLKMVQNALYGETVELVPFLKPGVGITSEEIIEEYSKL